MSDMIRLVYASQARDVAEGATVNPAIGGILTQSRRNNSRDHIGGVLYYGDGFFFQCLEGEREAVESTYARIQADSRHYNARVIRSYVTMTRMFSNWSMKYVPAQQDVQQFLKGHGMDVFNPYLFEEQLIDELLLFFHDAVNASTVIDPAAAVASSTSNQPLSQQPRRLPAQKSGWLGRLLGR